MNTLEKHMLPARIHLQIREGILNKLSEFELLTYGDPIPAEENVMEHSTNACSIIRGLAIAQRNIILEIREENDGLDPTTEAWLKDIFAWVVSA